MAKKAKAKVKAVVKKAKVRKARGKAVGAMTTQPSGTLQRDSVTGAIIGGHALQRDAVTGEERVVAETGRKK